MAAHPKTLYIKTRKGALEVEDNTAKLDRAQGQVLVAVDGKSTVTDLLEKTDMEKEQLHAALDRLTAGGFIRVFSSPATAPATAAGAADDDFDFTTPQAMAKLNAEAEARAKAEAVAKVRALAAARAAAEAKDKQEAGARARAMAEATVKTETVAKIKAEAAAKAAAEAHIKAEAEAKAAANSTAKEEAETRVMAAMDAKVRADAEAKARAQAVARARIEAAAKAQAEVGANIEAESRTTAEAEARALADAETRARAAVEAQMKKLQEAVVQARAQAEAERNARTRAEDRAKAEAVARVLQEQQLRASSEDEIKVRVQQEIKVREKAEIEADARYRRDAAARAKAAAEERRNRESETKATGAAVHVKKSTHGPAIGIAIAIAVVIVAIVGVLEAVPLNNYIGGAQQILSQRLGVPVAISNLRYSLLRQELVLERVGIGKLQEIKVEIIKVSALPTALLGDAKSFDDVEVISVIADQDTLALVPEWLKPRPGALPLHVRRVKMKAIRLSVKALDLPPFDADVTLGNDGALQRALLSDGKARLDIAYKDKALRVALEARNWKPPLGLPIEFDEFALEALVEPQQAAITKIEAKLGFAPVKGGAKASWGGGAIRVEGNFDLVNGDLTRIMPLFTRDFSALGQLTVNATYALQGTTLENLFADPKVSATFNIGRGSLNNVDMVRAIQSPTRDGVRGGKTAFNTLAGSVQLANKSYAYRRLQLSSGPMNASGNVDVAPNGDLSGRIRVELGARTVVVARGALAVTGNLKTPVLKP